MAAFDCPLLRVCLTMDYAVEASDIEYSIAEDSHVDLAVKCPLL